MGGCVEWVAPAGRDGDQAAAPPSALVHAGVFALSAVPVADLSAPA